MGARYGAWAQLLALFRLIHDGGRHGSVRFTARHGRLFDPRMHIRFAVSFSGGRPHGIRRGKGDRIAPPMALVGCSATCGRLMASGFQVTRSTSSRLATLSPKHIVINLHDVLEQKGSERVRWLQAQAELKLTQKAQMDALSKATTADEVVAAIGKKASRYTPSVMPVGALYLQPTEERRRSGSHYTPRSLRTREAIAVAFWLPMHPAPRRCSSVEYTRYSPSSRLAGSGASTPRTATAIASRVLTQPIVATTFRPIFERLGDRATPEQILDLKVCDPAMGSGAFLVEACRLLSEKLVRARQPVVEVGLHSRGAASRLTALLLPQIHQVFSVVAPCQPGASPRSVQRPTSTTDCWEVHKQTPRIPEDEDVHAYARRLVAERCLYGVDKNVFAVDLAKLSLWLATLAREHPFTFLDHSLRHGDSLVGLSREQIACFNWEVEQQLPLLRSLIDARVTEAQRLREQIQGPASSDDVPRKEHLLRDAEDALADVRLIGDVVISSFFERAKPYSGWPMPVGEEGYA